MIPAVRAPAGVVLLANEPAENHESQGFQQRGGSSMLLMSMLHSGGQSKRTLITIDGKTYRSVEEIPPELRQRYESAMAMLADRDGNGIPDQLESGPPDRRLIGHVETSERIFVNGREYGSWKEVPPEVRGMMAGEMPGRPRGISFQLNGGALLVLLLVAAVLGAAIAVVVMS